MASTVNKVILIGHLGNDPEVRTLPNGHEMVNFSLATNDVWRDKQTGERKERTEWHRISLFGRFATIAGQYLNKGSYVYIEGKLRNRKYQTTEGEDRRFTDVIVDPSGTMQMLGGRRREDGGTGIAASDTGNRSGWEPSKDRESGGPLAKPIPGNDFDSEIPF